jgi:hypothetical protein
MLQLLQGDLPNSFKKTISTCFNSFKKERFDASEALLRPLPKSTSEVCTRSQKQQKHSFSWIIHSLLHWGHKRSCFSRETVFKKVGAKAELPKISTKQVLKVAKSAQPSFHSKFLSLVLKNCLTFFPI